MKNAARLGNSAHCLAAPRGSSRGGLFFSAPSAAASALFVALACIAALAPSRPKNTYRASAGTAAAQQRPVSPEIHADRTVTFRLRAPRARAVELALEGSKPMVKDANGVWSITAGPLEPEIYLYNFVVDGVRILDPGNANLKNGRAIDASVVELPGQPARFDEVQNVPHGALQIRIYYSTVLQKLRRLYVYTPPQYDTEPSRKFPVLYLKHGNGDNEENWSDTGRAGTILDNLIAQKKAVPMLIVMPNGDTDGSWAGGSSAEGIETLGWELLTDVVPTIDKTYRVARGRLNRAIAGLSMGGGQAFTIGLKRLDTFAWVGEFSSGLVSDTEFQLDKYLPGFLDDPAVTNKRLRLLYLSCGTEDPRFPGQLDLADLLKARGINYVWFPTPGRHEWKVWRHALADFAPRLFR